MLHSAHSLKNHQLAASDGDIGHVRDIYFDSQNWTVRYLVVNTGAWLLGKEVLIPAQTLGLINVATASIRVNLTLNNIKDAPDSDTARPVSRQDDIAYHDHYGLPLGFSPWVARHAPRGADMEVGAVIEDAVEPSNLPHPSAVAEPGELHLRSVHDVVGHTLCGSDQEIGFVGDFLIDDAGWSIRFFVADTALWFGKAVVVPTATIRAVSWDERTVYLTIPRERVKHAPEFHTNKSQDPLFEQRLAEYYEKQRTACNASTETPR